jgi:hypothetical protein
MNVMITFKIPNDDEDIHPAYQEITCHRIVDVTMEDFRDTMLFFLPDDIRWILRMS